ncbi:MAG: Txe/YoeB family addiction module toxin [Acidobacteria bacterium]|nr:Txe/YoeB family addiction module toxin [Acidobacteriota bacterium]
MRRISFLPEAFKHFNLWSRENTKIHTRITELIKDIGRNPFSGIGKPEPLKYKLKGLWSRRITDEHRLVYKVSDEEILIYSCRFHYEK